MKKNALIVRPQLTDNLPKKYMHDKILSLDYESDNCYQKLQALNNELIELAKALYERDTDISEITEEQLIRSLKNAKESIEKRRLITHLEIVSK